MSKESDQLMAAHLKAEKHYAAWGTSTRALFAKIAKGARKSGMEEFRLLYPIWFSGDDYHDEYVRVRFDEAGVVFVDSCDNDAPADDLPDDVVFSACRQFMNTAFRFLHKQQ